MEWSPNSKQNCLCLSHSSLLIHLPCCCRWSHQHGPFLVFQLGQKTNGSLGMFSPLAAERDCWGTQFCGLSSSQLAPSPACRGHCCTTQLVSCKPFENIPIHAMYAFYWFWFCEKLWLIQALSEVLCELDFISCSILRKKKPVNLMLVSNISDSMSKAIKDWTRIIFWSTSGKT